MGTVKIDSPHFNKRSRVGFDPRGSFTLSYNHDSLDKVFVITIHSYRSFPASSSRRMCSSSS